MFLSFQNPQNIIVDRLPIPSCSSDGGNAICLCLYLVLTLSTCLAIKRKDFKLGPSPVQGDWTIIAKRTCDVSRRC